MFLLLSEQHSCTYHFTSGRHILLRLAVPSTFLLFLPLFCSSKHTYIGRRRWRARRHGLGTSPLSPRLAAMQHSISNIRSYSTLHCCCILCLDAHTRMAACGTRDSLPPLHAGETLRVPCGVAWFAYILPIALPRPLARVTPRACAYRHLPHFYLHLRAVATL